MNTLIQSQEQNKLKLETQIKELKQKIYSLQQVESNKTITI